MSGDLKLPAGMNARGDAPKNLVESSPLKLFGLAKQQINKIFQELSGYISEGDVFLKREF